MGVGDLSGVQLEDWEKLNRTANVYVMSFDKNFKVRQQQTYTLWHANWEVYVGRFVSADQDGLFLYDRKAGEGRMVSFDRNMHISRYQMVHNLDGNWLPYSGDFTASGRAQLMLYDPSSGSGQILTFDSDLKLVQQQLYPDWGQNKVLYVGHFGMSQVSIMLYDPLAATSSFLTFDKSLEVAHEYDGKGWDQRWQILVGSFLDHSRCIKDGNCATGDDILVLDRQTGQIMQYVFSFGRKYQVYDNRIKSFERLGVTTSIDPHLNEVDTTTFNLIGTFSTDIKGEELY